MTRALTSTYSGQCGTGVSHDAAPQEFDEYIAGEPPLRRLHLKAMFRARLLVNTPTFNNAMLAVIVANTVVLAMEYDGMPDSYARGLVSHPPAPHPHPRTCRVGPLKAQCPLLVADPQTAWCRT